MSVSIGPNIVNDGLILKLDASNIKSFKGEPTVNLCGTPTIGVYNNPGIPYSISNTGEYFKGYPIRKITFLPTTSTHINNLCDSSGVGAFHSSVISYHPDNVYMSSIYFKTNYSLLSKNSTLGFNHTYSNIEGWGYNSTQTTKYFEDGWYRLYTKFYKTPYVTVYHYPPINNFLVNTTKTESIIFTCPITYYNSVCEYIYSIISNNPYIYSNGGLIDLSIINHGLNTTNWTKLSSTNFKLKEELPFNYYIQMSIPSTGGIDKTIQIRNRFNSYSTLTNDSKYWKITFDPNCIKIGDKIDVYWACPMIEQKNINKPSFYTTNTRGNTVETGGGLFDLSGNRIKAELSNSNMIFDSNNNGSILFNNDIDYINLPDDIGYTTKVSVFSWVKCNGAPKGGYHIIIGGESLEISIPSSGSLRVGVTTNLNSWTRFVTNHGSGLTDGKWHYIGFTFDGSTKIAYIDGIYVGKQENILGSLSNIFSYRRIGRFGTDTTYALNGNIASITFYNRDLTQEEILKNYNTIKSRFI